MTDDEKSLQLQSRRKWTVFAQILFGDSTIFAMMSTFIITKYSHIIFDFLLEVF